MAVSGNRVGLARLAITTLALILVATMLPSCGEDISEAETDEAIQTLSVDVANIARESFAQLLQEIDDGVYGRELSDVTIIRDTPPVKDLCERVVEREVEFFEQFQGTGRRETDYFTASTVDYFNSTEEVLTYGLYGAMADLGMLEDADRPFPAADAPHVEFPSVAPLFKDLTIRSDGLLDGLKSETLAEDRFGYVPYVTWNCVDDGRFERPEYRRGG